MISLLMGFLLLTTDYRAEEEAAFLPYRTCVLSKAAQVAAAPDDARTLEAAARSACQTHLPSAEAIVALNAALKDVEDALPEPRSVVHDPLQHFERMKQALSDDFAAAIVAERLKAKTDAQN